MNLVSLFFVADYDQKQLSVDVNSMLEDELAWLGNFVPSENPDIRDTDNTLLSGHLKLISTLLTCEGVDKSVVGKHKGSFSASANAGVQDEIVHRAPPLHVS